MKHSVSVIGIGMTTMARRDLSPEELTSMAASEALSDAGLSASEVGLVLAANALGGSLNDQACIRGQTWLKPAGLDGVGVINIDNSCAGGASAFHLGVMAASAGESPVLVVGTEKMWTGSRGHHRRHRRRPARSGARGTAREVQRSRQHLDGHERGVG